MPVLKGMMFGYTGVAAAIAAPTVPLIHLAPVEKSASNVGSQIVSMFGDGTVRVWNNLGECKYTIRGGAEAHPSSSFSFTPRTGLCGGTVKVWNLTKSKFRCTLSGYRGYANTVVVSRDGSLCLTGSKDGLTLLYKRPDEKSHYKFHDGGIVLALLNPNPNRYWLCAAIQESVTIWDLNNESIIWDLKSAAPPPPPISKNQGKEAILTETARPSKKRKRSDLDRLSLEHVLRRVSYRDGHRFGSVCRWWQTVQRERIYPPAQFPFILLPNQNLHSKTRTVYSPSDGISFEIFVPPKAVGMYNCASYHGWLLMADYVNEEHLFLFNLYTGRQVELPQIGFYFSLFDAYVSSDPSDPDCIVAFPVDCQLMLCRVGVGDSKWTEYTSDFSSIRSMASCRGQLYCLDKMRNLMTIDLGGSSSTMRLVPMENSELPLLKMGIRETEYLLLVESCGELLMVLVSCENRSHIIRPNLSEYDIEVQVFRADLSKMAWMKVKSLGDRVLFMGRGCSVSLSAADIGGQGNHVYFSNGINVRWREGPILNYYCYWYWLDFDLGSGQARHWIPPIPVDDTILRGRSVWVAPNFLHRRS